MWISRGIRGGSGRHRYEEPLGPLTLSIRATPEVVFDVVAAPYLGRTPRAMADKLHVLERGSDLVIADHFTPLFGGRAVATTRETVHFDRPHHIRFRLLSGPVAHVEEEYLIDESAIGSTFTYRGVLASDLPVLGRRWARLNAQAWMAAVRGSVQQIAKEAERRAGRDPDRG